MSENQVRLFKPENAGKDPLLIMRRDIETTKEESDAKTPSGQQEIVNTEAT